MLSTESFKKFSLPADFSRDFSGTKLRLAALLAAALFGAILLWWIWLWLLFDADTIREKTKAALSQHLSREVTFSDEASLSLFPLPQVELYNLQVPNPPESRQPSMLLAPKVLGDVHFLSALGGDLILDLQIIQPRFEIDNTPKAENPAWQEQQAQAIDPKAEIALISSAKLVRGKVHYQSPNYKKGLYLEDINGAVNFQSGGSGAATFTFQLKEKYYQLKTEFGQISLEKLPIFASLTDGTSTLSLQGEWEKATDSFEGKHEFTSTDLSVLLENLAPQSGMVTAQAADASKLKYPVQTKGAVSFQQNRLNLPDFSVEGEHLKGKGVGTVKLDNVTDANIQIAFEKLSIDPLLERDVFTPFLISSAKKNLAAPWEDAQSELTSKGFPENIKLLLTVTSQQASVASMPATKLQMQALMQDGFVDLKQLSGKLPGDTQFLLQGKIDESFDGIALRGKLDVSGLQFRELMQKMVGEGMILPEDYARFRGRSNIFISPRLVRFSEGVVRVEDMQLLGALIRYDESKNPASTIQKRYEGAFRVDDLDIDALASLQAEVSKQAPAESEAVEDPYPPVIHMLRRLTSRMQGDEYMLEFSLPRYRFHGERRTNASLKLQLKENIAEFKQINTSYNGAKLRGDIRWNFAKEKPYFNAALTADRLNTERFFDMELKKKDNFWLNDATDEWSKAAFNLNTLYHYDGEFNLQLGQMQHGVHRLKDVKLQGVLEDALLRFYDVEANLLGGAFVAKGGLHASKLPTFYGDFSMSHLDIRTLHGFTDIFDPVAGRFNLSGNFTTAGVNIHSMIQNAQGSLSLAGGGVTVKGFNLENMVRAANAVRTVDDIDKLVKYAQQGGETRISSLQGSLNLGNGAIQSPGMKIATRLGNGSISGQMNLMAWDINASVILYLQALQERSPPNIKLIFDGPVQAAERRLETESLESFIARKAAKRLLKN